MFVPAVVCALLMSTTAFAGLKLNTGEQMIGNQGNAARLFVIGGGKTGYMTPAVRDVDAFYVPAEPTRRVPALPTPRAGLGAATLNGLIYAVGGWDGPNYLASVDVYVPCANAWFSTTPMKVARCYVAVCTYQNKLYAIGGIGEKGERLSSAEVFDPETRVWNPIKSMSTARHSHGVGVLRGEIYAIGGSVDGVHTLSSVEKYDPKTDQWSPVAGLDVSRWGFGVVVVNKKLYAIGGFNVPTVGPLKSVEVYDPEVNDWHEGRPLPTRRYGLGADTFGGLIYVAGGQNETALLDSIEIFDPQTNVWMTSSSIRLSTARYYAGVTIV